MRLNKQCFTKKNTKCLNLIGIRSAKESSKKTRKLRTTFITTQNKND